MIDSATATQLRPASRQSATVALHFADFRYIGCGVVSVCPSGLCSAISGSLGPLFGLSLVSVPRQLARLFWVFHAPFFIRFSAALAIVGVARSPVFGVQLYFFTILFSISFTCTGSNTPSSFQMTFDTRSVCDKSFARVPLAAAGSGEIPFQSSGLCRLIRLIHTQKNNRIREWDKGRNGQTIKDSRIFQGGID